MYLLSKRFFKTCVPAFALLIYSCNDLLIVPEDFSPEGWKPIVAVPLVYGDLDIYDMLDYSGPQDQIFIEDNNLVKLVYNGRLVSFDAGSAYQIPSQNWSGDFLFPSVNIEPVDVEIEFETQESFLFNIQTPTDVNGDAVELNEIELLSGNLSAFFDTDIDMNFTGTATIPQLLDASGNAINFDVVIIDGETYSTDLNLSGYKLLMEPANNVNIILSGQSTANALDIVNGASFNFGFNIQQIQFATLRGYLGQFNIANDQDSIFIDIFRNTVDGYFQLLNPELTLHCQNSFGLPTSILFNDLKTVNVNTGEEFELLGPGFQNPLQLAYPSTVNTTSVTDIIINSGNSNIETLLNPAPKILYSEISAITNPDGNSGGNAINFITNTSRFTIDLGLDLPLEGFANLNFKDTLPLTLSETIAPEEIEKVEVRTSFSNRFPFDCFAQLYFLNNENEVTDSLFNGLQLVLPKALVDENGNVITSGDITIDVILENQRVENFFNTKRISVVARGITDGYDEQNPIKIVETQGIRFNVGAKFFTNLSNIE